MTYFRLLWVHLRLGLMNELQYRANFGVQLLQSAMNLVTSLLGLGIIFSKTDSLGGWGPAELLAIVGVYMLVSGTTQLLVRPSLARFMEDVRLGTLDFTLTKPVDAQTLVSMRQFEVWKFTDVLMGVIVLGVATYQLGETLGPTQGLAFVIALICGVLIIYSFLFILATCAFWFVRLDNILNIFQSLYEAGRWPIGIYPPWLRSVLTFLVPVGFAVTVPAEGLIGKATWTSLLGAVGLAVVMPIIARLFWRVGVRHYSGASA
ncbi:MAG: ABC-2 family transporter protein [Thermomicrobiales bacterium]